MSHGDESRIETALIGIVAIVLASFIIIPLILWKSVSETPSSYQNLTFKDTYKAAFLGLFVSFLICLTLFLSSNLAALEILRIGNLGVKLKTFGFWIAGNVSLGSLAYFLLPIWRGLAGKSSQLKDQIY